MDNKCRSCGKPIPENAKFCRYCGAKQEIQPEPNKIAVTETGLPHTKEQRPAAPAIPAKKKSRTGLVLAAAGLAIAVLLAIRLIPQEPYRPENGSSVGTSGGSLSSTGGDFMATSLRFASHQTPLKDDLSGQWQEQHDVGLEQECYIEFSDALLSSSENGSSVSVIRWDGSRVSATVQISRNVVSVKPVGSYEPGQYYLVTVEKDFQSSAGRKLEQPLSFCFVTEVHTTSSPLVSQWLTPSDSQQQIVAPNGLKVLIPGGLLEKDELVEIEALAGVHDPMQRLGAEIVGTYDIRIGDNRFFEKTILLEIPVDMDNLTGPLAPEYALTACYWDDALYCWVDAYAAVDVQGGKLIVPTNHLSKWAAVATRADGHIYNEYFSMYYSSQEMRETESTSYAGFVAKDYIDSVFDALNEVREKYEKAGFRQLEKFEANRYVHGTTFSRPYFNVYLTGPYDDNATRNKYTGNITIPVNHFGEINYFQIAHELFHSVQNRYYYLFGMTEMGVPFTTSPSLQLLARQWWLESSADYAAGRIAYPNGDSPNPDMGGILAAKHLEKPLTYSPTALTIWAPEDRHSYNNAWLFEFLVQEKGFNFRETFEAVASYWNPSIYSNLVSYVKSKGLDFNDVYCDYAVWWFSHPGSPLTGARIDQAVKKRVVLEYPAKHAETFLFLEYTSNSTQHTTQALKFVGKDSDKEPRYLVVRNKEDLFGTGGSALVKAFVLPKDQKQAVSAREIPENGYAVHTLSPTDALYVLAVKNQGKPWNTQIELWETDLFYEYTPLKDRHHFEIEARNIPAFLEKDLTIIVELDGKDVAFDRAPVIKPEGGALVAKSSFDIDEVEGHQLSVRVVTGLNEVIAKRNIKNKDTLLKIDPPEILDGRLNTEYKFALEITNIPEATAQIEVHWDMDDGGENSVGSGMADSPQGSVKASLKYQFKEAKSAQEAINYAVRIWVTDALSGEKLAEKTVPVTIFEPGLTGIYKGTSSRVLKWGSALDPDLPVVWPALRIEEQGSNLLVTLCKDNGDYSEEFSVLCSYDAGLKGYHGAKIQETRFGVSNRIEYFVSVSTDGGSLRLMVDTYLDAVDELGEYYRFFENTYRHDVTWSSSLVGSPIADK